jgi:hypothetical protein
MYKGLKEQQSQWKENILCFIAEQFYRANRSDYNYGYEVFPVALFDDISLWGLQGPFQIKKKAG